MKIAFVITNKYFRGKPNTITYYVSNIRKLYGDDATIIIVDNNSTYLSDIDEELKKHGSIIITNDIESKFELGGYQVGCRYLIENNLVDKHDYYVFTQDTMVIKNKYDFDELKKKNVKACTIFTYRQDITEWKVHLRIFNQVLDNLELNNRINETTFCWANSFIVGSEKIGQLYGYLQKIVMRTKDDSQTAERFLARILFELNEHKNYDIDGDIRQQKYDCHSVNIYDDCEHYFVKRIRNTNEQTRDK